MVLTKHSTELVLIGALWLVSMLVDAHSRYNLRAQCPFKHSEPSLQSTLFPSFRWVKHCYMSTQYVEAYRRNINVVVDIGEGHGERGEGQHHALLHIALPEAQIVSTCMA